MSNLTSNKSIAKKPIIKKSKDNNIINHICDSVEEVVEKKKVKVIKKKKEIVSDNDEDEKIVKPIKVSRSVKIVKKQQNPEPCSDTEQIKESEQNEEEDAKSDAKNETNSVNTNQDASFILKKNKQSGNFSILKKSSKPGIAQRVRYTAYNVFLPFGKEEYNDNLILNAVINDATNLNHNLVTTLKRIIKTFEGLRDTEPGRYKYSINDKTFFSYMKELDQEDADLGDTTEKSQPSKIKKYQLRLYLRYGAKVTHAKHVGELTYDQLRGKRCNLDIELGSMWVNNDTMMYGINIHVTHVTVLN